MSSEMDKPDMPERWTNWMHNVVDKYKGMSIEAIKEDLARNAFPFAVMMENWQGDFNLGQCVRNANAFGAREVFYLGKKRYDRRGSVGTYNYTPVNHLASLEDLLALKSKYVLVGIDNIAGSVPCENHQYHENSLFIFGEEGCGLTPETLKLCDELVSITQFGSVRSLNAGCSSGIIMYDYVRKYRDAH